LCDHPRVRGKNIAIGVLAAAGFFAIVRLSGGPGGGREPAPPTPPPPSAPLAEAPTGPEATPEPGEISVLSLLGEMIDLEHLAHLSNPPYTAQQAASTDRRSRRPQDGESWFANDDFVTETQPNLVRVERRPDGGKRYVLLDTDGPGAIVRIWTATTGGTLRIQIDGDEQPALEAPVADLLRGAVSPFVAPLAHVAARGNNLYFPFPFARHCLVTVDDIVSPDPFTGKPLAKLYYQIGYRRYRAEDAARVRSYSAAQLARAAPTIGRVAKVLVPARRWPARDRAGDGPARTTVRHDDRRAAGRRRDPRAAHQHGRARAAAAPLDPADHRLRRAADGRHASDRFLRHGTGMEHVLLAAVHGRQREPAHLPVPDAVREARRRDDRARRSGRDRRRRNDRRGRGAVR
jgi:hypothetical protein